MPRSPEQRLLDKQRLLEQFARVGRALATPARLELLDVLAQGEKPVEDLAREARHSVTSTSNHLRELRTTGLVTSRKQGRHVYYRLADASVHGLLRTLRDVARSRLPEVREIVRDAFDAPDALEPVGAAELIDRLGAEEVLLLDVRPADEYAAGHLPGAVSLPLPEVERRLAGLPRDREIVAYCRGPYCVFALEAVERLRARGFRARRTELGVPEWRALGGEVRIGARP